VDLARSAAKANGPGIADAMPDPFAFVRSVVRCRSGAPACPRLRPGLISLLVHARDESVAIGLARRVLSRDGWLHRQGGVEFSRGQACFSPSIEELLIIAWTQHRTCLRRDGSPVFSHRIDKNTVSGAILGAIVMPVEVDRFSPAYVLVTSSVKKKGCDIPPIPWRILFIDKLSANL